MIYQKKKQFCYNFPYFLSGHDTTASGISWTLYSLAEHPEYQEKVQAEIDDVLEGRDTDFIQW